MLKSCLPYLGSPDCLDNNETKSSKELELGPNNWPSSFSSSTLQSKHIFVRVVHAGGRVEHYPNAVLAAKLLENLPAGKWLARPEVFKQPHESIIRPEEYLMPGQKYYVVPLSTLRKLKRKHNKMSNGMEQVERSKMVEEEISCSDVSAVVEATDYETNEEYNMDDSFSSANEFYVRKLVKKSATCTGNGSSGGSRRAGGRILLPHAKPKLCSGYTWEPGLTSIQEVSP